MYGDDFVAVGPMDGLNNFKDVMTSSYKCKSDLIGMGVHDDKELRVLGRMISLREFGVTYEPDIRHVEAVLRDLGLEGANPVGTPGEKEKFEAGLSREVRERRVAGGSGQSENENPDVELEGIDRKTYQSLSARLNYLSLDCPEIQLPVKDLMRKLAKPTHSAFNALNRVARYLIGNPRMVQEFRWQKMPKEIIAYVDSDLAGCTLTRKSTSGGAIVLGNATLKTWSKTQSVIASSSGEAELAAMVKGCAEAMGMRSVLADFGVYTTLRVRSDATAAIGMVRREGLGKVRHLAVADLWIQGKQTSGEIVFDKICGKDNPADLMTKCLNCESMWKHTDTLGFAASIGRHKLNPYLTT